jgi:hypothetical protein
MPTTLAPGAGSVRGFAVDATGVYWSNAYTGGTSSFTGAVWRVGFDGRAPTLLAYDPSTPESLSVDGASVYWLSPAGVLKVALSGAFAVTTLVSGSVVGSPTSPHGIAVDATLRSRPSSGAACQAKPSSSCPNRG